MFKQDPTFLDFFPKTRLKFDVLILFKLWCGFKVHIL